MSGITARTFILTQITFFISTNEDYHYTHTHYTYNTNKHLTHILQINAYYIELLLFTFALPYLHHIMLFFFFLLVFFFLLLCNALTVGPRETHSNPLFCKYGRFDNKVDFVLEFGVRQEAYP